MSLKVTILYNKRNVKYIETVTLLVLLLFIYNNTGSQRCHTNSETRKENSTFYPVSPSTNPIYHHIPSSNNCELITVRDHIWSHDPSSQMIATI